MLGGVFARLILLDGIAPLRWIGRLCERFPIGFALAVGMGIGQNLASLFPHVQPSTIMVLGMAGYLAGVTQTPLTASVISMELTNNQGMVLPILAMCLLARAFSALVCKVPVYRAFTDHILEQHVAEHAARSSEEKPS